MVMSRTQVLTDEMWARIESLLPPLKGAMGRPMAPPRTLVEESIFRLRSGLAWRDLPAEFGPWQTVWKRYAKFSKDGTWDKVLLALQTEAHAAGEIDWNVSVDSTIARVHQRRDWWQVGADGHRSHRGLSRMTKIRWVAGTNRTIALLGAPEEA